MVSSTPARAHTPAVELDRAVPATLGQALAQLAQKGRAATRGLHFVDGRGVDGREGDGREGSRAVPWAEVAERARATAGRLRALGIERGDRVALLYSTCPEFFDVFFGTLILGAVPTPLYPPVRLGRMDEYDHLTSAMLVASGAKVALAEPRVRRLLGGVRRLVHPPLGFLDHDDLAELEQASLSPEDGLATGGDQRGWSDELALVQFSSGTTVSPKPVALSHAALLHQGVLLAGHWPDTEDEEQSGVSWLPLYHDMGLIGCVVPALLRCADLHLIPPEQFIARPALWLRTLSRTGATVSPAPNFAYALCVDRVRDRDLEGVDLSRWRAALNGAETVSMATVRAFTGRFAPWGFEPRAMTAVYGLSEATLAVTFGDLERPPSARIVRFEALGEGRVELGSQEDLSGGRAREIVSVGRPVPGFTVEIRPVREDGDTDTAVTADRSRVLPEGEVGEIFVQGPSLLSTYLGTDEAGESALEDGWLATGDLGFLLEGELFHTGRRKDLLVLRGRNRSPEPIEEAVSGVEGVRAGCVVAVSALVGEDPGGESLWVLAETRLDGADELEALAQACRDAVRTATGLDVARLDLLQPGEIPRTSSGKLRRSATRDLAEAGRLQAAAETSWLDRVKRQPMVQAGAALVRSRRRGAGAPSSDTGEKR